MKGERAVLRRISVLAANLALVTKAYTDMDGDALGGRHVAASAVLEGMHAIVYKLKEALGALDDLP